MLWIRAEHRLTEHRTPLVPADAAWLVAQGMDIVVEESPHRVHPVAAYQAAGCTIVPSGWWRYAPDDAYVLGLKELPATGALAVLHESDLLPAPLEPTSKEELDDRLARAGTREKKALVIGALGRCGSGARHALAQAGREVSSWDLDETQNLDRSALLDHDLLVNAVLTNGPVEPFVTADGVADPLRRLTTIADVTCDVGSPNHTLPIYDATTTWAEPVRRIAHGPVPLDVIAIDNLPSLLPCEASNAFSADLAPLLLALDEPGSPWTACRRRYQQAATFGGAS
jgi:saccharopine dehydrogenase (NAD+, L-lysine-forming)